MSKEFTPEQIKIIKDNFCKGATDGEVNLFIEQCKRTGLDPASRQIYLQERKTKNKDGSWNTKRNVEVSIDGFRVIAQRSGQYAGQSGPFWHDGKQWLDVWLSEEFPKAAKVGVLRHDFKETLWGVATWESYVQTNNDGKVGHMWSKMPDLMLAKVAEALALRKAFPNDLSGLYSPDEMAQADNSAPTQETKRELVTPPAPQQQTREVVNHATGTTKQVDNRPTPDQDLGNYVVQCGKKHKGKTLNEIGEKEVESYFDYLQNAASREGKPLSGAFLDFTLNAREWLASGINQQPDEIPF